VDLIEATTMKLIAEVVAAFVKHGSCPKHLIEIMTGLMLGRLVLAPAYWVNRKMDFWVQPYETWIKLSHSPLTCSSNRTFHFGIFTW
jgi:hypothetical protein